MTLNLEGLEIRLAKSFFSRAKGLLGESHLAQGKGLLLVPCSSVHTWGMQFPIDLVFLDKEGRVMRLAHSMSAFSYTRVKGAFAVLEMAAGAVSLLGWRIGAQIEKSEWIHLTQEMK